MTEQDWRRLGLGQLPLALCLLLFWGCGRSSIVHEPSEQSLRPTQGSPLRYSITQFSERHWSPQAKLSHHGAAEAPVEVVSEGAKSRASGDADALASSQDSQRWSSNLQCSVQLNYQGVESDPDPFHHFKYSIDRLSYVEREQWGESSSVFSWEESYGEQPKVSMRRGGLDIHNPMGLMKGDPRQYFWGKEHSAYFSLNGVAKKKDGALSPAHVLDGEKDTAAIGQYFFKGLKAEQWVHRLMIALPKNSLRDGLTWESEFQRWYETPPRMRRPVERWSCSLGPKGWVLKMEVKDEVLRVVGQGMKRPVSSWVLLRKLEAVLDVKDLCPLELHIKDSGQWQDELPSGGKNFPRDKKVYFHRWSSEFVAHRT